MKYFVLVFMLCVFNAHASDAPKKADDKAGATAASEKPQLKIKPSAEAAAGADSCTKYEYKDASGKIVCIVKPSSKPAAKPSGGS
jgi:hypothetical protein